MDYEDSKVLMKHKNLLYMNLAHRIDVVTKAQVFRCSYHPINFVRLFKSSNKPAYSRTHFFLPAKENGYIMRSHNLFKLGNSTEEAIPDIIFCATLAHGLFVVRCYLSKVKREVSLSVSKTEISF